MKAIENLNLNQNSNQNLMNQVNESSNNQNHILPIQSKYPPQQVTTNNHGRLSNQNQQLFHPINPVSPYVNQSYTNPGNVDMRESDPSANSEISEDRLREYDMALGNITGDLGVQCTASALGVSGVSPSGNSITHRRRSFDIEMGGSAAKMNDSRAYQHQYSSGTIGRSNTNAKNERPKIPIDSLAHNHGVHGPGRRSDPTQLNDVKTKIEQWSIKNDQVQIENQNQGQINEAFMPSPIPSRAANTNYLSSNTRNADHSNGHIFTSGGDQFQTQTQSNINNNELQQTQNSLKSSSNPNPNQSSLSVNVNNNNNFTTNGSSNITANNNPIQNSILKDHILPTITSSSNPNSPKIAHSPQPSSGVVCVSNSNINNFGGSGSGPSPGQRNRSGSPFLGRGSANPSPILGHNRQVSNTSPILQGQVTVNGNLPAQAATSPINTPTITPITTVQYNTPVTPTGPVLDQYTNNSNNNNNNLGGLSSQNQQSSSTKICNVKNNNNINNVPSNTSNQNQVFSNSTNFTTSQDGYYGLQAGSGLVANLVSPGSVDTGHNSLGFGWGETCYVKKCYFWSKIKQKNVKIFWQVCLFLAKPRCY